MGVMVRVRWTRLFFEKNDNIPEGRKGFLDFPLELLGSKGRDKDGEGKDTEFV
jgi:hypothetical protein